MNSRVLNLLEKLSLKDRISKNVNLKDKDNLLNVNFNKANENLNRLRTQSKEWLLNALRGVEKHG